jgi:hypothetical protein
MVLDVPELVRNRAFLEQLDLERLSFDPARMRSEYAPCAAAAERYPWPPNWNPEAAFRFKTPLRADAPALEAAGAAITGAP